MSQLRLNERLLVLQFVCGLVFLAPAVALGQDEPAALTRPADGHVTFEPSTKEADIPARFQLAAHEFPYWQSPLGKFLGTIAWQEVLFPSPVVTPHECNNTVHCEYFAPMGRGKRPGVIVLHILGGDFELSRVICRTLATSGTGALFVKMPYYGPRRDKKSKTRMISQDPDQTVRGMTQAALDIRRAVTWLETRDNIDPDQLGIVGISLGGIVGAMTAAIEPRFSKACLVLAGGDFGQVLFESAELAELRKEWQGKGITKDQVREVLRPIDPLTYAHRLRDRKVLMMNAKFDKVIPRSSTDVLWEAIGKPEIIWWDAGHYSAAMYLPSGLGRMAVFFGDRDDVETARQAGGTDPELRSDGPNAGD